jgi:hypothetical protein
MPRSRVKMTAAASGCPEGTGLFSRKVTSVGDFEEALGRAMKEVKARKGAFVEAILEWRE